MSMEDDFKVLESAAEIINAEYAKVDLDGEDCPLGDDCAIHFRNDEEVLDNDVQFGRIITYVGDYVIVTDDNAELDSVENIIRAALGVPVEVDRYEITVLYVGDGALADLRSLPRSEQLASIRYLIRHDNWDTLRAAHDMIVEAVQGDYLDLELPCYPDEVAAQLKREQGETGEGVFDAE